MNTGRRIGDKQLQSDHDLLNTFRAETNTKLERVITDLANLSSTVTQRVATLEAEKLNKETFDRWRREELEPGINDRERRIRRLESWGYTAIGAIGLLQLISLVLGIYSFIHFK